MKRKMIYLRGNEKYHSSYLLWKGENLVNVYEDVTHSITSHKQLQEIESLDGYPGLVRLRKRFDYAIDEEGYFQYIKRYTTEKVYLVFEVVETKE